ncbi:protein TRM32 isoform X2 [Sesamum indicum]|uniref:Protein TRM32 isoform X2 n=1 Tax=Sesamum indicum TaxID=4182 RepID=A0A6I9TU40_SESIN|nr:protein TRM32 isoform X2 [Sesamum indicum]
MGKHFWFKHANDDSHSKQPGCMWGLVHVLNYHHWQFNVRKMIQHHKHEDRRHNQCDWTPAAYIHRHDAHEAEKLLSEKESSYISTKRSRATKKRSLKARIKALIAEEISKDSENVQGEEGFSFKSNLQRTYSIHHMESLADGFGKIHKDSKHRILFLPRNVESLATQSLDTTQMKAAGNQEASRGKSDMYSPMDTARHDTKEDSDLLEIFKVDKELLIRHLQDADESFVNFSHSALGLNSKAKFGKSRSFPLAELSRSRKLKPIKLENKQREVWSFPREDKSHAANQASRLAHSDYLGRRSGELADDDESNGISHQDIKAENIINSIGEKHEEDDIRKRSHRRSSSLNESMYKYTQLFENSFRMDTKLKPSNSLKLANEYGPATVFFRRIGSLSNVDSYYSNSDFEVLGDDLSGNGSTVTENDRSSALLKDDRENVPLNANAEAICHNEPVHRCNSMQIKEDDASLRLHISDDNTEKLDDLKAEADKLDYSDIVTKEIIDQGFILDSDVCLEETECYQVDHQISEGLEPRSTTDELNSSIDYNDLKSLHSKSSSTHITLKPEKGEIPDTVAEGVMLGGHSKKSNSDLYYVRHLLHQSGIAGDLSDVTWHTSDQLFSPKLFEKVEACWPHERDQLTGLPDFYGCWHHRMLFDLVDEVLLEVYDMSLPYYPKPLSSSCHVRPFPMGSHIIEEVSTRAGMLLNLKPDEKQSLDCIAAHDLYHDRSWMNLQLESECVALDVEEMMFNELLEEVIFS